MALFPSKIPTVESSLFIFQHRTLKGRLVTAIGGATSPFGHGQVNDRSPHP
jgi:hypothetical protein